MATQTFINNTQELYIAYYGRPGDSGGLDFWADEFEGNFPDLSAVLGEFGTSAEFLALSDNLSTTELIEGIFLRSFSRYPDAEGLAFYTDRLDSGAANLGSIAKQILDGATGADEVTLANKVTFAKAYTAVDPAIANLGLSKGLLDSVNSTADSLATALGDIGSTNPASSLLTLGQDNLSGTAGDDEFNAYISNNSNTLQSGDMVDGGAGVDTLFADIGSSQSFAITPHTESVEKLVVRGQADGNDSGDNNISNVGFDVQIDAQRMNGTDWYETQDSRETVLIEDVRIEDDQITKDITIAMVSTDPGAVDYGVYFDQHSLRAAAVTTVTTGATLTLQVMDIDSQQDDGNPLTDNPYAILEFTLGGETVELILDEALISGATATYATLNTAIQNAIDAKVADVPALANVTATVGADFTVIHGTTGNSFVGSNIILTNSGAELFVVGSWGTQGNVPPQSNFWSSQSDVPPVSNTDDPLITSTIILDDVGRGSNGGDLVVGGLSTGLTSGSRGVEQFDITVERSSILGVINSTNNTLEEVFIVNGATQGNLTVNGNNAGGNQLLGDANQDNAFGFSDVRVLDASAMVGSVNLTAEISDASLAKYLQPIDTDVNSNGESNDDLNFDYDLGTNNDVLALTVGTGLVEDSDFSLVVDGNEGNDRITLSLDNDILNDAWYTSHQDLDNLTINGGAGNDVIMTPTMGDVIINAGSGDDAVFTDNTGSASIEVSEVQTLTFAAAGDITSQGQISITLANGVTYTTAGIGSLDSATLVGDAVVTALAGITGLVANNVAGVVTLTYGTTFSASSAGNRDIANAIVSGGIATDLEHTVGAGTGGTDAVAEVVTPDILEVTTLTMTNANPTGTLNFLGDGVVTLVDTDNNGSITIYEQAEQLAAIVTANANYTVTSTNFSLGQVTVTAVNAVTGNDLLVTDLAVAGVTAATVSIDTAGAATTTTPASAEVVASQTLTIDKGADRDGSVFVTTDGLDGSTYEIAVTVGNARDAALEIAAALQATAEFATATVGATDSIITLTWAAGFGAEGAIVLVDGATMATTSIVETVKGRDAANATATTDVLALDTTKAIWTANNPASTSNEVDQLDVANVDTFEGIKGQLRIEFTPEMVNSAEAGGLTTAWVDIDYDATSMTTSSLDIRQAIKEAIASDTELSHLLLAKDGPNDTVLIQSLIDGLMDEGDLTISFQATPVTAAEDTAADNADNDQGDAGTADGAAFDATSAAAAYNAVLAESNAGVDFAGGNATQAQSDDTVDAGAGTDVVVLSTSAASEETVVFTGSFDRTTVVYFDDNADDMLDFSSYLDGSDAVNDGDTVADTAITADNTVSMSQNNISIVTATVFGTSGANAVATAAATTGLYLVISATDEHVANVYTGTSAAGSTAVATALVGVIDLTDVEISGLTTADFAQFA